MSCVTQAFPHLNLETLKQKLKDSNNIPENIRFIYQPAYSPQLMPVEHIWEDIREKHFYNHVYNSLDVVDEVLCQGLLELCSEPQRLSSLTFFPHLRLLL